MDKMKAIVISVLTALSGWLGILAVPMYLLVVLNITDYATGIYAAHYRGEVVSSARGLNGIVKKIYMWLLVGLGAAVDWLLMYATEAIGVTIPVAFLAASFVAVWLICNEIISILENIAEVGTETPSFLVKLVKKLKEEAENCAEPKSETRKIDEEEGE